MDYSENGIFYPCYAQNTSLLFFHIRDMNQFHADNEHVE